MSEITYEEFSNKFNEEKRGVLVQTVIGRSGSLFLQSLLDNHPEILMFPGVVNFFIEIHPQLKSKNTEWEDVIKETIGRWISILEPYNIHHNLGDEMTESIWIDTDEIISIMHNKCNLQDFPDSKTLFIALHYAIGVYFNIDLSCIKYIYVHEHTSEFNEANVKDIISLFPKAKIICSVKDPRANHLSIYKWLSKRKSIQNKYWEESKYIKNAYSYMCYRWYRNMLALINKYHENFLIIRLEDIHTYRIGFLKSLCDFLEVKYHDNLLRSTFNSKIWSGDNFSAKKSGFRQNNTFDKWRSELSPYWNCFYELKLRNELKLLEYNLFNKKNILTILIVNLTFPFWYFYDIKHVLEKKYYLTNENNKIKLYIFFRELYLFIVERIRLLISSLENIIYENNILLRSRK